MSAMKEYFIHKLIRIQWIAVLRFAVLLKSRDLKAEVAWDTLQGCFFMGSFLKSTCCTTTKKIRNYFGHRTNTKRKT